MPKTKDSPKRFVITAAQAYGGNGRGVPNRNFLAGLEKYCKVMKAELIIIPMAGSTVREQELHHLLVERDDIHNGRIRRLNRKIAISDMIVPPQNVDPSSGRLRFPQQDRTLILAHPKQRLKAVPNSNYRFPKFLVSTGALTSPNYRDTNHRGDVAKRDHIYGALIVETVNSNWYYFRHVRANTSGVFVDLGNMYDGDKKPTKVVVEAIVPGDIHVGDTDPEVLEATFRMIKEFRPQRAFLHDLLNGHSVNHWNMNKMISRIQEFQEGRSNLKVEFKECLEVLCRFSRAMGKGEVVVVPSNHNERVNRYLEGMRLVDDPENCRIASKLIAPMVRGEDPVAVGLGLVGDIPKNVTFLDRDDDYKVCGFQLGSHGDIGMSGARGSIRSREFAHGKSITGHTHTPEIMRNTVIVGTSTFLRLPYTKGSASSWMNSHALLYENGAFQLLHIIDGKWAL